ncbi:MAG: M28 family peptidase [Ferruginibacter sp.]
MKNTFLLAILLLGVQLISIAQADNALKFATTITTDDLKKHLTIIAGDEMEGRETGTEGQRKAAAYIESQFKAFGLASADTLKGYQQLYPLYQDSLVNAELVIGGKTAEFGKDYYSQATLSGNGKFKGKKIIFIGYGIDDANYSDYTDLDVKGKIVVFFSGEPKKDGKYFISGTSGSSIWSFPGTQKKLATAAAKGAIGAFIINSSQSTFIPRTIESNKKTNVYYPSNDSPVINHVFLSHEFAQHIITNNFDTVLKMAKAGRPIDKEWKFEKKIKVSFKYEKVRNIINASNVIGVLEGSDKKDEFVFVTGHYDHLGKRDGKIYYGADDDGSGTCAVIEMADAFTQAKAAGFGPRRTIVFMTVSGEEKGLWGSEYYSDHPVFPLNKTSADLNIDMVGRVDTERKTDDTLNYVYVIGHDKLSSNLPLINEGVNKKYTNLVFDYKYDDPKDQNQIYFRSDHYNFARKGVPILFFYDGMLKADYHKTTDTVDKINWELYEKRVKMIFHTAWEIANRDDMLQRDIPLSDATRQR